MLGSHGNKARFTRGCQIGAFLLFVPIMMAIDCPPTVTIDVAGCPDDGAGTVGTAITFTITATSSDGSAVTLATTVAAGDAATVADGDTASPTVTPTAGGTVTVSFEATAGTASAMDTDCVIVSPAPDCTDDAGCDDSNACTTDACTDSVCANTPIACADGETCVDGTCVKTCTDATDCDDADACTADTCVDGACSNAAGDNDNGVFCDGVETCDPATGDVSSPGDPCTAPTAICDEDGDQCVECLTDTDCTAPDTCVSNVCTAPAGFSVAISGCPAGNVSEGSTTTLTVASSGAGGTVTFAWTATGGLTLDTDTGATVVVTAGSTAGTVTVTGTDTVTDDAGTPDDDTDDTTTTSTASATCTIGVESALKVDAGPDRDLIPVAADFTGGVFAPGSQLFSTQPPAAPTATAPQLVAVATDPNFLNTEISFLWEYLSGPAGAADVIVLVPTGAVAAYQIIPALANSSPTLAVDGQAGTIANTVIPGSYIFRVTATNPAGDTATDEVAYNFSAAYAIPGAATPGSLQGMSLVNGSITRRVIAPSSFEQMFASLSTLGSGTATFSLLDDGDTAAVVTILAANYADFVARQTLGTAAIATGTSTPMTTVTSPSGGTFLLQAQLAAGAGSTANATLNAFHVQPALTGTIDIRPPFAGSTLNHLGIANSSALTAVAPFTVKYHGARQGAAVGPNAYDGTACAAGDINGDGSDELIVVANTGAMLLVRIYHGITADPTVATNSPFPTAINNAGVLVAAGGLVDSFLITGSTAASRAAAVVLLDFDGNGSLDLAIGDPLFNGGTGGAEGRVTVYYHEGFNGFAQNPYTATGALSGGAALAADSVFTRPDIAAGVSVADLFGSSLASGRINSDAIDDLVVGSANDDVGGGAAAATGAVYGFNGSAARYPAATAVTNTGAGATFRLIPAGALPADFVGAGLCVADVNGDTFADVVYGSPGYSTLTTPLAEAGIVYFNLGSAAGLTGNVTTVSRVWEGNVANLGFGRRLTCCNFTGALNIIVSAEANSAATHTAALATGRVFAILASQGNFTEPTTTLAGLPQIVGAAATSNLGSCIACGETNGDGFDDLMILGNEDAGFTNQRVTLIHGSAAPANAMAATAFVNNAAGGQFLSVATPLLTTLDGALYHTDGCCVADVNGDKTKDFFWQGFLTSIAEAAFIAGAE